MEIQKENWNNFILAHGGSFLQGWEWGEFQEKFGRKVKRFAGEGWAAQFIEYKLPCVNKFYWYAPRGPIVANRGALGAKYLEEITKQIKEEVGKDAIFFRFGPEWEIKNCHSDPAVAGEESLANASADKLRDPSEDILGMTKLGFRQLPYDIEPSQTQVLDITKTEDELLAQMHEKWRYNIRLSERKGVQVKLLVSDTNSFEQYFEEFYRLVSGGTAERKGIKHHPKEYYRKQLETGKNPTQPSPVSSTGQALKGGGDAVSPPLGGARGDLSMFLFVAEYEGKVIAANIVVIFGNRATYLHGATSSERREVMAPHLLQWEQIKYAKSQGCTEYDFWGIVNEHTLDKRGVSWEGFTRFKRGFGGQEVNYVGYFDYPLNGFWYFVYRLVQKLRR